MQLGLALAVLTALLAPAPASAQPTIRIGASLSLSGAYAKGGLLGRRVELVVYDDAAGFQTGHKMITFQWQDGQRVIVWPDELASGRARFPTPPWTQR